jgi:hypothetical protein
MTCLEMTNDNMCAKVEPFSTQVGLSLPLEIQQQRPEMVTPN